jgi:hypothetical protein
MDNQFMNSLVGAQMIHIAIETANKETGYVPEEKPVLGPLMVAIGGGLFRLGAAMTERYAPKVEEIAVNARVQTAEDAC